MSGVTPRYLSDWEKRTVEFPTVKESGRGIEFEILGADMISASFLSSFRFSLLWAEWVHQPVVERQISLMNVISKRMMKDRVAVHNIRERCGILNEENRSQDRSPWDSAADGHWGRATVVYSYSLSSVCEVRREPVECSIMSVSYTHLTLPTNLRV